MRPRFCTLWAVARSPSPSLALASHGNRRAHFTPSPIRLSRRGRTHLSARPFNPKRSEPDCEGIRRPTLRSCSSSTFPRRGHIPTPPLPIGPPHASDPGPASTRHFPGQAISVRPERIRGPPIATDKDSPSRLRSLQARALAQTCMVQRSVCAQQIYRTRDRWQNGRKGQRGMNRVGQRRGRLGTHVIPVLHEPVEVLEIPPKQGAQRKQSQQILATMGDHAGAHPSIGQRIDDRDVGEPQRCKRVRLQ